MYEEEEKNSWNEIKYGKQSTNMANKGKKLSEKENIAKQKKAKYIKMK